MEDVLEVYKRPYDEAYPVICMDEKPYQLLDHYKDPIAMSIKNPIAKEDYEYVRKGTASIFVFTEPLKGWRRTEALERRTRVDWAHQIKKLLTVDYADAKKVVLILDNCKTAAQKPDYYDPQINKDYARLTAHYGCSILPARPYRARDKASGENTVKFIEAWVIAYLRDGRFFFLGELNAAIKKRVDALNSQPFRGASYSRNDVFEKEYPLLMPLQPQSFELEEWRRSKVNIDYCIQLERQKYEPPRV